MAHLAHAREGCQVRKFHLIEASAKFIHLFDSEDRTVPTITFVRENIQVEVPEGDHVRYPALENDVPVYCGLWKFANCHGNGLCGTDRVAVAPTNNTNPLTFMEKFWLRKDLKKNPNMRLSCQVEVYGNVTVDTQCNN
jgi:ferredoxin